MGAGCTSYALVGLKLQAPVPLVYHTHIVKVVKGYDQSPKLADLMWTSALEHAADFN